MRKCLVFKTVVLSLILTAGCATPGKGTAIGAGAGAAAGAGAGAAIGGWKGAIIGAGVGVLAGGSVGNYLDKQKEELDKVAQTKRTENGVLVQMSSDILFDIDSTELKQGAIDQVSKVGDILAKYSDDRIRIEGHTDSSGSKELNDALSLRRAEVVRNVLLSRGVKESQILVLGKGSSGPIASNHTAEGRAKNRRVELHIDVPHPT